MINLKKSFIAVLLLTSVISSLFCAPSKDSDKEKSSGTVAESNILLSDSDSASESGSSDSSFKKSSSGIGVFIRMIVVLLVVVGLIFLVFYFIKRKTGYVKEDDDYLRRAAYINIGPGKTVEVITLIDKAYLIGVTEDNISLLGEIHDDELIKAMNITADKKNNTKKPSTFSDVLDMFLVKGNKQKSVFDDDSTKIKVESVVSSEADVENKEEKV